jgi:chromosomal replication initiator protein
MESRKEDRKIAEFWQIIYTEIKPMISTSSFEMLFPVSYLLKIEDETFTIGGKNVFITNNLKKFIPQMVKILKNHGITDPIIQIKLSDKIPKITMDDGKKPTAARREISKPEIMTSTKDTIAFKDGLNQKFTFDNYIQGDNNDMAVSVAQNIAKKPGKNYNPLFVYGGVGVGKTHLIQAVGNQIKQNFPEKQIVYITAEHFMNDFTLYLEKKDRNFHKKYRKTDVLIIDDVQFFIGKEGVQNEFFNAFNELYNEDKQIIVASDQAPEDLKVMERLRSRLNSGIAVDIGLPKFEMRRAIIETKAREVDVKITDEAANYLAEHIRTNVRELMSTLNKVLARCELQQLTADIDIVKEYLNENLTTRTKHLTPRIILMKTAKYYQLKPEELQSASRESYLAYPRHIASWLMRNELKSTWKAIALETGRKDHTTAMSCTKKIDIEMHLNHKVRSEIEEIQELLYV